uniref:Peptidase S1 domain-containing protein n=1 Tax=Oryzias melastigma TaxID=30732 RepID=A0A3B3DUL2_ORYME
MASQQLLCVFLVTTFLLFTACGKVSSKNKKGDKDGSPGSWPWQVLLKQNGYFFCSGSLITNEWVLTSRYCMYNPFNTTAHLGLEIQKKGEESSDEEEIYEETRSIADVKCHSTHGQDYFETNDICLLKLSEPVELDEDIQPVCLASEHSTFFDGTTSWIAGFTQYDENYVPTMLTEIETPIVGAKRCACNHGGYIGSTDKIICAGEMEECPLYTSLGGPMVNQKEDYWVQSGVMSSPGYCGYPKLPGVYTQVSEYQEWISDVVRGGMRPEFVTFKSPDLVDKDVFFICPSFQQSVFDDGENLSSFTHVFSLSLLVLLQVFFSLFGM